MFAQYLHASPLCPQHPSPTRHGRSLQSEPQRLSRKQAPAGRRCPRWGPRKGESTGRAEELRQVGIRPVRPKETSEWKQPAGQTVSSASPKSPQGNAGSSGGPYVGLATPSCCFLPEIRPWFGKSQTPCKWTQSTRVIFLPTRHTVVLWDTVYDNGREGRPAHLSTDTHMALSAA